MSPESQALYARQGIPTRIAWTYDAPDMERLSNEAWDAYLAKQAPGAVAGVDYVHELSFKTGFIYPPGGLYTPDVAISPPALYP